jgi:hypothetical protein
MNAKESITNLRNVADMWSKMANHPKYYNTEGAHYLSMAAQALYQESDHIQNVCNEWGIPHFDELEVI